MTVAYRVRFIRKLLFMLSLVIHPAFRVGGRYRLLGCPAVRMVVVILIFFLHRRFPQLRPLLVHLFPQTLRIYSCGLGHLFFLVLFLVCTCFDVGSVYEYHAAVHHSVVQRLVQNMLEDFRRQFFRKPSAERVAYRREMRQLVQQPVSQKPTV